MTYRYVAYGLQFDSIIEFPELLVSAEDTARPPDVGIRYGVIPHLADERSDSSSLDATASSVALHVPGVARFAVTADTIIVDRHEAIDDAMLRLFVLGACIALVLHLRGFLVLHASAVSIDGHGVIFVGNKGAGKSTTAASLVAKGHKLIADDIVAIALTDGRGMMNPGFPQLKLSDSAVNASLDTNADLLPRVHTKLNKRSFRPDDAALGDAVPVSHIFVLGVSERTSTSRLSAQEAFVELIRFTYVPSLLAKHVKTRAHFDQCVSLAATVEAALLFRPDDLSQLSDVADFVVQRVAASV